MVRSVKNKKILILIFVFVFLLYILNIRELNVFFLFGSHRRANLKQQYLINNTGCKIPFLEIYDEEIMNLLGPPNFDFNCGIPLVCSNLTSLYIDQSVFETYGIQDINHVECHYTPFWRVEPAGPESDNKIKYGKPRFFRSSINVEEEFVKVECRYYGNKHIDFHSFVPDKKPMSKLNTARAIDDEKLNVVILGIDSLSRLHFYRKMPKTAKFLTEKMKAIEYFGYNKLGDNTFPNLIPAFTGYRHEELKKGCWPNSDTKFDNCSFVFQNYTKNGYITNFAEESSDYGIFDYYKKGWFKQPTDYYWNTFDHTAANQIQHYPNSGKYPMCMGPRPMFRVLLESGEKFISKMKNHRFFSFLWATTLSHNHVDIATLGEEDYVNHLKFLSKSGVLNDTILIVMSDHGFRFGKIARTHQGHLEERLPFVFFVLPPWFQTKYPIAVDNMKKNAYRLTSPFDLYATLNHILHPDQLRDEYLRDKHDPGGRSVSFFLPISPHRTCDSADIPTHWCTCQDSFPVDTTDPVVTRVAEYSVSFINDLLKDYPQCASLNLTEVTKASLAKYGDVNHNVQISTSDYEVMFKTLPGNGWFGSTVRCTYCEMDDFRISGTISRLNIYGNSSYCIDDFNLKLYCYCI